MLGKDQPCAPWTTLSGVAIAVRVWLSIAFPGGARPCTDSGDVRMALALSFRDPYCTGLTDRSPCRAEIVVNDALRAGVPPA